MGHESSDISCLMALITQQTEEHEELLASMPDMQPPEYMEEQNESIPRDDVESSKDIWVPVRKDPVLEESLPETEEQMEVPQFVPFSGQDDSAILQDAVGQAAPEPMVEAPAEPVPAAQGAVVQTRNWTSDEMFVEVHGKRSMHWGARRTWLALNKRFPGHRIPYRWIEEKVAECSVCQLYRRGFENYVEEIVTHLKPPHSRARVGFDGLTVTPPDVHGNTHLIVIVDHYKKYVWQQHCSFSTLPSGYSARYGQMQGQTF